MYQYVIGMTVGAVDLTNCVLMTVLRFDVLRFASAPSLFEEGERNPPSPPFA
jgi:hypothetical protein